MRTQTAISIQIEKVHLESPAYTVVIINFGQDELIPACLSSVKKQITKPAQIIVVDNSGQLRGEVIYMAGITLLQPATNSGYAGGSNLALALCQTDYILIMNPDILLETDYSARTLTFLEQERQIAAVGGLLLRYDFKNDQATNLIDSAGIAGSRSGRFWDRGQGNEWTGQFSSGWVFGVSGAAAFYRVKALLSVAVNGEIFDEDMLAYKEDIDIAWRLSQGGWSSALLVEAVAYHGRSAGGSVKGWRGRWAARRRHSLMARRLAFKNQFLLLVKNSNKVELDLWTTLMRQLMLIGYTCIFEPSVLGVVPELISQLPRAWAKRRLQKNRA
ncbi:glycosyltransferase [Desulfosporosinus fructosivorans]